MLILEVAKCIGDADSQSKDSASAREHGTLVLQW